MAHVKGMMNLSGIVCHGVCLEARRSSEFTFRVFELRPLTYLPRFLHDLLVHIVQTFDIVKSHAWNVVFSNTI